MYGSLYSDLSRWCCALGEIESAVTSDSRTARFCRRVPFVVQLSRHRGIHTASSCYSRSFAYTHARSLARPHVAVSRTARAERKRTSGSPTAAVLYKCIYIYVCVCVCVCDLRCSQYSRENLMSKCHAGLAWNVTPPPSLLVADASSRVDVTFESDDDDDDDDDGDGDDATVGVAVKRSVTRASQSPLKDSSLQMSSRKYSAL
jgi:hypothetical protein